MAQCTLNDLFGKALASFADGDDKPFLLTDETGRESIYSLANRFRPPSKLNATERRLICEARGRILDVGSATGNLLPPLARRGQALGIDISPAAIEVARRRGVTCQVADIFTFQPDHPFDTVTLFGNGLGIGGTAAGLATLLRKMGALLAPGGQILAVTRNFDAAPYREMMLTPHWNGETAPTTPWIIFSIDFLTDLAQGLGLHVEVLMKSWKYRLVRLTLLDGRDGALS